MISEIPFVHHMEQRTLEEIKEYFQPEVFIKYCMACEYYDKIWTCPSYDFDITKILEDYKYAYIIGSKLYINDLGTGFNELLNSRDTEYAASEIYKSARRVLDEKLVALKKGSELILLAGRCLICKSCRREEQLPCIHKEKARFSLESLGFNVSAICEEILGDRILWAKESLPEYFMYVSAIFSQEKLKIEI